MSRFHISNCNAATMNESLRRFLELRKPGSQAGSGPTPGFREPVEEKVHEVPPTPGQEEQKQPRVPPAQEEEEKKLTVTRAMVKKPVEEKSILPTEGWGEWHRVLKEAYHPGSKSEASLEQFNKLNTKLAMKRDMPPRLTTALFDVAFAINAKWSKQGFAMNPMLVDLRLREAYNRVRDILIQEAGIALDTADATFGSTAPPPPTLVTVPLPTLLVPGGGVVNSISLPAGEPTPVVSPEIPVLVVPTPVSEPLVPASSVATVSPTPIPSPDPSVRRIAGLTEAEWQTFAKLCRDQLNSLHQKGGFFGVLLRRMVPTSADSDRLLEIEGLHVKVDGTSEERRWTLQLSDLAEEIHETRRLSKPVRGALENEFTEAYVHLQTHLETHGVKLPDILPDRPRLVGGLDVYDWERFFKAAYGQGISMPVYAHGPVPDDFHRYLRQNVEEMLMIRDKAGQHSQADHDRLSPLVQDAVHIRSETLKLNGRSEGLVSEREAENLFWATYTKLAQWVQEQYASHTTKPVLRPAPERRIVAPAPSAPVKAEEKTSPPLPPAPGVAEPLVPASGGAVVPEPLVPASGSAAVPGVLGTVGGAVEATSGMANATGVLDPTAITRPLSIGLNPPVSPPDTPPPPGTVTKVYFENKTPYEMDRTWLQVIQTMRHVYNKLMGNSVDKRELENLGFSVAAPLSSVENKVPEYLFKRIKGNTMRLLVLLRVFSDAPNRKVLLELHGIYHNEFAAKMEELTKDLAFPLDYPGRGLLVPLNVPKPLQDPIQALDWIAYLEHIKAVFDAVLYVSYEASDEPAWNSLRRQLNEYSVSHARVTKLKEEMENFPFRKKQIETIIVQASSIYNLLLKWDEALSPGKPMRDATRQTFVAKIRTAYGELFAFLQAHASLQGGPFVDSFRDPEEEEKVPESAPAFSGVVDTKILQSAGDALQYAYRRLKAHQAFLFGTQVAFAARDANTQNKMTNIAMGDLTKHVSNVPVPFEFKMLRDKLVQWREILSACDKTFRKGLDKRNPELIAQNNAMGGIDLEFKNLYAIAVKKVKEDYGYDIVRPSRLSGKRLPGKHRSAHGSSSKPPGKGDKHMPSTSKDRHAASAPTGKGKHSPLTGKGDTHPTSRSTNKGDKYPDSRPTGKGNKHKVGKGARHLAVPSKPAGKGCAESSSAESLDAMERRVQELRRQTDAYLLQRSRSTGDVRTLDSDKVEILGQRYRDRYNNLQTGDDRLGWIHDLDIPPTQGASSLPVLAVKERMLPVWDVVTPSIYMQWEATVRSMAMHKKPGVSLVDSGDLQAAVACLVEPRLELQLFVYIDMPRWLHHANLATRGDNASSDLIQEGYDHLRHQLQRRGEELADAAARGAAPLGDSSGEVPLVITLVREPLKALAETHRHDPRGFAQAANALAMDLDPADILYPKATSYGLWSSIKNTYRDYFPPSAQKLASLKPIASPTILAAAFGASWAPYEGAFSTYNGLVAKLNAEEKTSMTSLLQESKKYQNTLANFDKERWPEVVDKVKESEASFTGASAKLLTEIERLQKIKIYAEPDKAKVVKAFQESVLGDQKDTVLQNSRIMEALRTEIALGFNWPHARYKVNEAQKQVVTQLSEQQGKLASITANMDRETKEVQLIKSIIKRLEEDRKTLGRSALTTFASDTKRDLRKAEIDELMKRLSL